MTKLRQPVWFFFLIIVIVSLCTAQTMAQDKNDDLLVNMTRRISKELLGNNSDGYMRPLVTTINAASNSRFFRSAHVPNKVDKPYFRFGIHAMTGFVRQDQLTFSPIPPTLSDLGTLTNDTSIVRFNIGPGGLVPEIRDTVGLVVGLMKYLFHRGLQDPEQSGIRFPDQASTVYGNRRDTFILNSQYFSNQLTGNTSTGPVDPVLVTVFGQLAPFVQDSILSAVSRFPSAFPLTQGGDISSVFGGVPQLEIGSLWGTEMLLRFIPPLEFDRNVGTFAFWGIGLKHSISQYFGETPSFDMAVQVVYQGTRLENTVGQTNAKLTADATIWSANVQFSKSVKNWFDVFGAFSYDATTIHSNFRYFLPIELQIQLGLLRPVPGQPAEPNPPEFPGDTRPQVSVSSVVENNPKFTFGLARQIGPVTIIADYNIGRFNILSFGLDYTF